MKKALISTIEPVLTPDGAQGFRVAQVEDIDNIFPVAEGLYWADCDDNTIADQFYFDPITQSILPIKQKEIVQPLTTGTTPL